LVKTFTFSLLTLLLLSSHAQAAKRPNIVMLLADDPGWKDS